MQWNTFINSTCGTRQLYRFSYDAANRLTAAAHRTWSGSAWTDPARYNESNIAYDLNGNLKTYTRQGLTSGTSTFGTIDNLTYTYSTSIPDRLIAMTDAGNITKGFKYKNSIIGDHYLYDANGNLTEDKHKDLFFAYNHLNLPNSINNLADDYIILTYTADGEKLTKVAGGVTKNYVSGIEYTGANLEAIYHTEGRCTPNGSTFYYEYTLKDHLGNARVNWRANGTAVIFLEELHYYPFGMLMEGIGTAPVTTNGYKYNSKELNADLGLNWYDYGARWYDPAVGRWWSVDPMAEKTVSYSTYTYALNNPALLIDPNGMLAGNPFEVVAERREKQKARNEERDRQIEQKQQKKLPEMWIANDAKVSTDKLKVMFETAMEIMSRNGYKGLKFNFVDVDIAKKHEEGYDYQAFLAIRNDDIASYPSVSSLDPFNNGRGHVAVYHKDGSGPASWYSYINLRHGSISGHSDPIYAAGYVIAHEFLHQLLAFSSYYRGEGMGKFDHDNSTENLNKDGKIVTIPQGLLPYPDLNEAEKILEYQRIYLDYFLTIER